VPVAASFVVIDKTGAIHFGPIQPGTTPYAGFEARDDLDSALDAIAPPKAPADDSNDAAGTGIGPGPDVGNKGGGEGYAPPMPTIGLLVRGIVALQVDTIVFADRDVDAGVITDTIAGLAKARIVGLGVQSTGEVMRFELAFHSLPPRQRGEVGGGPAFVVSAQGVLWWDSKPDGRNDPIETAWTNDARTKLVEWAKKQHSLAKTYVAIEGGTRLSHLMMALAALGDAGATDIELGRRWAIDKDGNVINYGRPQLRTEAKLSSTNEADQKIVLRAFKQRTPQLWVCIDKGRDAKPSLAGTLEVSFVVHDGAPTAITAKGLEPADTCLGDVVREMRFASMSAPDISALVKVTFPKS
jgi:hypothetical protein